MDGYAEKMLYDDVSTDEEITIQCPKCQLEVHSIMTDEFIKCKRCGEIFYIEEINSNDSEY